MLFPALHKDATIRLARANLQISPTRMHFLNGSLVALYTLSIDMSIFRGPELCLRVVRVRPDNADIFIAVRDDREEVALQQTKRLLFAGKASVLDVSFRGETILSVGRILFRNQAER